MGDGRAASSIAQVIDRRIRHAMRILENEQTPLAATEDVAARVGLSVFHFVRLFQQQVGLTPQDYGRAVLLDCAARRLRYGDEPVSVVAKDFGYAWQAGFNRAFTNHHGVAPARWRRRAKAEVVPASGQAMRLEQRPAQRYLARRYFGPRETVAVQWADFLGRLPPELRRRPCVGFAYDDPRVTPPGRIRRDCAVEQRRALTEALAEDGFEFLRSPAGLWAMADVPPDRVGDGYREIFDGWFQGRFDYTMEDGPYLERHGVAADGEAMVTLCARVRRVGQASDQKVVTPCGTAL